MMRDAIQNFPSQFAWEPNIEGGNILARQGKCVVLGMGGSHLSADLLSDAHPALELSVHSTYGLPEMSDVELRKCYFVAMSYSGNTEETLDGFEAALKRNFPVFAVSTGGKLLELAKARRVPYVKLPDTGIQPRMALGFMLKALLFIMGNDKDLKEVTKLAGALNGKGAEMAGKALAKKLNGAVPLVWASVNHKALARVWKIKFNESGKIPAFWNIFPELNHNEMTSFDRVQSTRALSDMMRLVLLTDLADHPKIVRRMEVARALLEKRGLGAEVVRVEGASAWEKIFSSLFLADWTALYLAEAYGVDSEQVPMVEEFKKII